MSPPRIASLLPAATEIVCAIGRRDSLELLAACLHPGRFPRPAEEAAVSLPRAVA